MERKNRLSSIVVCWILCLLFSVSVLSCGGGTEDSDSFDEENTNIVENNVVIVDHYHGISFYGMRNSHILNNTVIDQTHDDDVSPWIMVTSHKDGTPSENCIVANNIAYRNISVSGTDMTEENNYVVGRDNSDLLDELFRGPDDLDFHLIDSTLTRESIINQGGVYADMISSEFDRDGVERSGAPDLGAYEAL